MYWPLLLCSIKMLTKNRYSETKYGYSFESFTSVLHNSPRMAITKVQTHNHIVRRNEELEFVWLIWSKFHTEHYFCDYFHSRLWTRSSDVIFFTFKRTVTFVSYNVLRGIVSHINRLTSHKLYSTRILLLVLDYGWDVFNCVNNTENAWPSSECRRKLIEFKRSDLC